MKKIAKVGLNGILLVIFLAVLILPIGFMGTMNYEESGNVLSAQDTNEEPTMKTINDPEADVPDEVEEFILKMEREYYQKQFENTSEEMGNGVEEGEKDKQQNTEENETDDKNTEDAEELKTEEKIAK
ncbi:MAG TPA: hypothetical protein PKH50_00715 [bacterium]|jgi:hypothetical protein|nr:hypothetical protein [bacterium]